MLRNIGNWASEASPTLGCSIEISCDIYVYMYVCQFSRKTHTKKTYAKMRGRNYVAQTRACSKSDLGGYSMDKKETFT